MITKRIALTAHIQVVLAPSSSGTKLKSLERVLTLRSRTQKLLSHHGSEKFLDSKKSKSHKNKAEDLSKEINSKDEKFIIGSLPRFLIYRTLHTHIYELCLLYP